MQKKFLYTGIAAVVVVGFLTWLFIESSKPLPGIKIADLGRGHVEIGKEIEYNSNPPTSGPHYADWVRAGIYDTERDDRNMVHSLEHGYIIMYYKCVIATPDLVGGKQSDSREIATPASGEARNDECEQRKNQLTKIYEKKGKKKIIVVARPNLDTNFALTAWSYIDKFDQFDENRVLKFIDAHRDMGPEKTME